MKTVASGAHYTTVTVDTAEEVKFSFPSTSLSVEASGGDITVALTDTAVAGDDGTLTIPDGESRMFIHHRMNIDTYYLTGSGVATLYASNMGDVNPFNRKAKGGDGGGDTTHYKGTTTTPLENGSTTNPIVIDGESYTAVFGDVVVYSYTEFVFDGTTWSEFGRPFDTTPTQGSTNAVTSDGVYNALIIKKGTGIGSGVGGVDSSASGYNGFSFGHYASASGETSAAFGFRTIANRQYMMALGRYNLGKVGSIFEIGNGNFATGQRSNILEVSNANMNVNGGIKINNVAIPTPYTIMPAITADMLGKIAMYVGATGGGFTQGCFYVASTDGAAEPTYSWVKIGDSTLGLEEVTLWENDGTTNPETITLSEAITNFDECVIEARYESDAGKYLYTNSWLASADLVGMRVQVNDEQNYCAYTFTTSTTLTNHAGVKIVFAKIIGRRYTRVNPTGYREIELYSNDEHAATPIDTVLTLSQDWADFDAIGFISEYNSEVGLCAYNEYKVSTISDISQMVLNFNIEASVNSAIFLGKNTSNSFVVNSIAAPSGGLSHVYKIIGIKY